MATVVRPLHRQAALTGSVTRRGASRADVAELCRALSDDNRLAILDALRDGERCVCELTDALDTAQPLLSFHLRVLKEAGLVSDRREGRWAYYALTPGGTASLRRFLTVLDSAASARRRTPGCC